MYSVLQFWSNFIKLNMRKSGREVAAQPVPIRVKTLFHGVGDVHAPKKMELIHTEPNVYLIRDFLTDSEINYFDKICTVRARSFKSSFTEDGDRNEIVSEERTSSHVHLTKGQDNTVRSIERRAAELVGLSSPAVEPLQIVSYRDGQKFDVHHDAGTMLEDGTIELVNPRRLVTFFVYLNNLPFSQGHTEFPQLNLSVHPERGSAVVFCNVLPDGTLDGRTIHCAQPVTGNLRKFGINIWICDCDMQELAQVKAHVKVSTDLDIKDKQSALRNAERLTCKYNADVAITTSSSLHKAVHEHNPAEDYWTNPKRKHSQVSLITSNSSATQATKKNKVPIKFREKPLIVHSTPKKLKPSPKSDDEGDNEYSASVSGDLFSYSPDYWADYSDMGVKNKTKNKDKGPIVYSVSSGSSSSSSGSGNGSGSGGSSGYISGSSGNGAGVSSSYVYKAQPVCQDSNSAVFTDIYSFLNTSPGGSTAHHSGTGGQMKDSRVITEEEHSVVDLCSSSELSC